MVPSTDKVAYLLAIVFLVDALVGSYAVLRAPYPAFVNLGSPAAYLNIYIHVPVAMISYVLYTGAFISAILYLARHKERYDRYVYAFTLIATLYAAYVLISGSIWAHESWGSYWNWDPRETGVLLLFLAYLVYFALRSSIADPDRRPIVSATYAIAAYAMVPISYAAPRIASSSLHPTKALLQGFMEQPEVRAIFYTKVLLVLLIGLLAVRLYVDKEALSPRARRALKLSILVSVLVMLSVAGYLSAQYSGGKVTRVYAVFGSPSDAKLLVKIGNGFTNITIAENLSKYVVEGRIALVGHVVKLVGLQDHVAKKLEVLVPSCVILDFIFYALFISGLGYTLLRRETSMGEEEL